MEAFYVSRQGYQEGPHSLELINDKLQSGYLSPQDYIYDAANNDWILLSRFKKTQSLCEKIIRREEITDSLQIGPSENTWYLLRGNNQSGPYTYQEVAVLLQEKKAYEYDYVWAPSLTAWERISECQNFKPDLLNPFLNGNNTKVSPHFRRKNARVEHGVSLVLHNHKKLWNGQGFELSASGASIEIKAKSFKKGESVVIHYRPSKFVPAFNVHCEVVSCQRLEPTGEERYRVGLRFVSVNGLAQKAIRELVAAKAA